MTNALYTPNGNLITTTLVTSSATTLVLTSSSTPVQIITGTVAQTITLPVVSTISLWQSYVISNNSNQTVTVNSSGGNLVQSLTAGSACQFINITSTGTTATSWQVISYSAGGGVTYPISVANGGTGVTTSTGTGNTVLSTSPTLVTPVLGTPSSGALTNCTGLPISTGISGLGTGVATVLANNISGSGNPIAQTSPTLITPVLVGRVNGGGISTGNVGELLSSQVVYASGISITTATGTSITSLSLTAGDWDIWGNGFFTFSTGVGIEMLCSISASNGSFGDNSLTSGIYSPSDSYTNFGFAVLQTAVSVSSTTVYYLNAYAQFASGTCKVCGLVQARRRT